MSKTERALESEALDRDGVELFDDEAVDDPVAPEPTDGIGLTDAADGDAEADAETEPALDGDADAEAAPAFDDDADADEELAVDADADAEPQLAVDLDDDGPVDGGAPASEDVDASADGAGREPAGDGRGPTVPGEPLVTANGAARTAPLPPPDASGDVARHVVAPAADVAVGTAHADHADAPPDGRRDDPEGFVGPEPSEDVLEELRRADIDGPIVKMAPHDDTTSARRRPRRLPEYDPAPIPVPTKLPRVLGRKPRVRKVTRVVRSVDPWSVFKIALIASLVLYIIVLTSGVLLWNVAYATGTIDNVERFFESFGWSTFEFNGGEIYHAAWIGGLFAALGLTGLAVLGAALFNLITDLVGGIRLTVLEEEVVEARTSPMRRFVVRRSAPEVPAVEDDPSGSLVREAVVDDSGAIIRRTR